MKTLLVFILLSAFLVGCSKKSGKPPSTTAAWPFQPTVVETPQQQEINDIQNKATTLLAAKDFARLDAFAKQLRDSKEQDASGVWKLGCLYDGLSTKHEATDVEWTNRLAALNSWAKAVPHSLTAQVALANGLVDYAWFIRGHDFAQKVKAESWEPFFQRLNDALSILKKARTLKEKCPVWWHTLLRAELGLQMARVDYDAVFNEAIKEWPDYAGFYFARANYLLPRWSGAEGEVETDLEKSADKRPGDAGDMLYAQVVWNMHHTSFSTNLLFEYHFSWDRLNRGLNAIEQHYPDSLAVKNEAAHLALLAHDCQAAKEYFDQTQGQIDTSVWSSNNYVQFAQYVYGRPQ